MAFLFDPYVQPVNSAGPLAGAKLYFYQTGTTTPITVYQNATAATPHASPVVADANGLFPPIFVNTTAKFKTSLFTSADVLVQTVDPHNSQLGQVADLGSVTTTGSTANALVITTATGYTALATGIRILVKPTADNSSTTVNLNLDGLGNKRVRRRSGTTDGDPVVGDIQSGHDAEFVYDATANAAAGAWILLNPHNKRYESGQGEIGTAGGDNAVAGRVGEYLESIVLIGAAVALTTTTAADVTSISLPTGGDWDVSGVIWFTRNAATSVTNVTGWTSITTASLPTFPAGGAVGYTQTALTGTSAEGLALGTERYNFSSGSPTPVYLSARSVFTVNSNAAYGIIRARRVR